MVMRVKIEFYANPWIVLFQSAYRGQVKVTVKDQTGSKT